MMIRAVVFDIGGVLEITPDLGVIPMWEARLGLLRPRYRTGILSNSFVGAREKEQAAYGFEDLVDDIIYSHEAGMSKPDPRIYALACARLGVRPDESVFVDDTDYCVTGAREAGMHAVHFQHNAQAIEDIEGLLASS